MTTQVGMGARRSAVGMFTAGYSVMTIQQLQKGKQYSYVNEPVPSDKQL